MAPRDIVVATLLMLQLIVFVKADIDRDRQQCADQLVGLATCLPYVGGEAKSPTKDCCTGLKQVLQKSKLCLCILVKDRDDPTLDLKINATLALGLPQRCDSPANINECPSLLHLAPGSPEAKVFEDFSKSSNGNITTPTGKEKGTSDGSTGAAIKNDGGIGRKWLGVEICLGLLLFVLLLVSPHTYCLI